jgi:hypothetical protein
MSDTTAIPNVGEIRIGANAYQVVAATQNVALAATGDTHTLTLNFLEQIETLTMASASASQTSPSKTATFDFRWGTNNSTWSAWQSWSTGVVVTLAPDPNNRFYVQVRLTRGGATPTGFITWDQCIFNVTRNPNAFVGYGSLTDRTLNGDLYTLFSKFIEDYLPLSSSGAKRWSVVQSFPNKQSNAGGLIPVYLYGLRKANSIDRRAGGTWSDDPWELSIAVKTLGESKGTQIDGISAFDYVCQTIRFLFDSRTANYNLYSITFKGVDFLNVRTSAFSICAIECSDRGESAGDNDVFHTFLLRFTVPFNRITYASNI